MRNFLMCCPRSSDLRPVGIPKYHLAVVLLATVLLSAAGYTPAYAQSAPTCDLSQRKKGGPVSLLILPSSSRVRSYAATLKGVPIARQDASTIIFADGRVVTSDVSAASDHINALGWGNRSIKMVASFSTRRNQRPPGGGFG
jgi:hypothetical protein